MKFFGISFDKTGYILFDWKTGEILIKTANYDGIQNYLNKYSQSYILHIV